MSTGFMALSREAKGWNHTEDWDPTQRRLSLRGMNSKASESKISAG